MVLMEDRGLSGFPFSVSVRQRRILGQDLCQVPIEEVWVVDQRLRVDGVIVHHDGARGAETSAETSDDEVDNPSVGDPASHVEVLDWQLSDEEQAKKASQLGAGSVVGPVEIRAVDGTSHNALHVAAGEPASKDGKVLLSLGSPLNLPLL